MPYIIRDTYGHIARVSAYALPGGVSVAADHPEVLAFLESRGIAAEAVSDAIRELRRTDNEMSRAIEDVITALLKKNVLKITDLPKAVQDRIALRISLRMQIQQAYDRANQSSRGTAPDADQDAASPLGSVH